jgi:S1-C subfamily serine protease
MLIRLACAFAVAAVVAVLSALLRDVTTNVETLRQQLSGSAERLDDARRDIARLLEQNRRDVDARLTPDVGRLQREILGPSIQVLARGGVGGGTLLSSGEGRAWAVTAWHVVHKAVTPDGRETVEAKLYDGLGAPAETVPADLVAWDESKDLALLRLRTERRPVAARLASRETLRAMRVFTPLYTVGCPLGHDPLPPRGEVAALSKDVAGERFWMMNAPTIYGNSGGGVFNGDTHELIGVSVMICTYDGAVSTPVPHLGILAPMLTVYDWLDAQGYTFAYDPSASVEACEAERAAEFVRSPEAAARPAGAATTSSR